MHRLTSIRALCLGAKGVLVGRPWVYGLGIAGKKGAKQVLQGLLCDAYVYPTRAAAYVRLAKGAEPFRNSDQTMGLSGIKTLEDCDRKMLKRIK